jgi:hypothetical protein
MAQADVTPIDRQECVRLAEIYVRDARRAAKDHAFLAVLALSSGGDFNVTALEESLLYEASAQGWEAFLDWLSGPVNLRPKFDSEVVARFEAGRDTCHRGGEWVTKALERFRHPRREVTAYGNTFELSVGGGFTSERIAEVAKQLQSACAAVSLGPEERIVPPPGYPKCFAAGGPPSGGAPCARVGDHVTAVTDGKPYDFNFRWLAPAGASK